MVADAHHAFRIGHHRANSELLQQKSNQQASVHADLTLDLNRSFSLSVQKPALVRAIERERWYLDVETFAALAFHLISSAHHSPGRVQWCTACIFKALTRPENWLLSDNARSLDLSQFATGIRDHPVPAQQMHRFFTLIFDDHPIGPEVLRDLRRRSRLKIGWLHAYCYSPRVRHVQRRICHRESLDQTQAAWHVGNMVHATNSAAIRFPQTKQPCRESPRARLILSR